MRNTFLEKSYTKCDKGTILRLFSKKPTFGLIFQSLEAAPPEVFLVKGFLKICSKFTEEHPSRSVISIKLLCRFIEIILRHGYSPVNLLHIFRTPFLKNTSGWLLLRVLYTVCFHCMPSWRLSKYIWIKLQIVCFYLIWSFFKKQKEICN